MKCNEISVNIGKAIGQKKSLTLDVINGLIANFETDSFLNRISKICPR